MKIRQGFVSNSSSSSFIIGGDLANGCVIKIDLSHLGETIKNEEELIRYAKDRYGYTDEDIANDCWPVGDIRRILKSGKTAFIGNLDYNLEPLLDCVTDDYVVISQG